MKEVITTGLAPKAVGPYSQGVKVDGWIFVSMQLPLDPQTGMMVEGGTREQTSRIIENIEGVLTEAGASLADLVKMTVYFSDLGEFAILNEVFAYYFSENPPARAALQAAALPLGATIAIDAIAYKK